MSPRERWLAVLNRQTPDRVPMDYQATPEADKKLLAYLGCAYDEMIERLHIDKPYPVGGRYVGPLNDNEWGYEYRVADYGCGTYNEVSNAPLAKYNTIDEIEANYRWPKPDDYDYSHIADEVKGKEHLPIMGGGCEVLLIYRNLRGDIQSYIDLVENPEIVHYCLDKLFELAYENTRRIFEAIPGMVMITYVAEDLGAQDRLIYSPQQIEDYLMPNFERIIELVKQNGSYTFHHDDGAIRNIIPRMIEAGIDVLNPIQWRCEGMDRESLKRDFGDKLIFHAGVDNQYTLPFGTPEEVRQEVIDNYKILGAGGGYILGPCHNIQSVGPPENTIALYETGYEHGWR